MQTTTYKQFISYTSICTAFYKQILFPYWKENVLIIVILFFSKV